MAEMNGTRHCSDCGSSLPPDAPPGVCPACELKGALAPGEATAPMDELLVDDQGDDEFDLPRRMGDFELIEEIARGGMGIVYRARQISLDRAVAVKILPFGALASAEFIKRFRAEASAAASLHHPNIVAVHEVGVQRGQHYLVMDFVDGPPLSRLLDRGPLTPRRAAGLLRTIAQAVHYAHEHGILHRDLKPSNILVDADDQPQVTDFGLAKRMDGESSLTLTGQVLGSPNYMPPEQAAADHGKVTRRSDVYGLGAIMHHLLAGRPPFQGATLAENLQQVLHREPVSLRLLNPGIPADLETICLKCLAKESQQRYGNALEVAEELGRFLADEPIRARPLGLPGRVWRWCRRKPAVAALAASVTLATGLGLAGVLWQWRRATASEAFLRQSLYVQEMNLAHEAVENHNFDRAQDLINGWIPKTGEEDLRGFEWRYLWQQCNEDVSTRRIRTHDGPASQVVLSPHHRFFAVSGSDQQVVIGDLVSGQLITRLIDPDFDTQIEHCLAFSPDGNALVVTSRKGNVSIFNTETWSKSHTLTNASNRSVNSTEPGSAVLFSRDGSRLITARDYLGADRFLQNRYEVLTWDTETWRPKAEPIRMAPAQGEDSLLYKSQKFGELLAWLPEHRLLIAAEEHLFVRDLDSGVFLRELTVNEEFTREKRGIRFCSLTVSPDGALLAAGDWLGGVTVWNTDTWEKVAAFSADSRFVTAIQFSPSGALLATGGPDRIIRLWDTDGFALLAGLKGSRDGISSLAFLNEDTLLSTSRDGLLTRWNTSWRPRKSTISYLARTLWMAPDDTAMLTINLNRVLEYWDLRNLTVTNRETFFADKIYRIDAALAVSADRQWIAFSHPTGDTEVWHLPDRIRKRTIPEAMAPAGMKGLKSLSLTRTGDRLITPTSIWDLESLAREPLGFKPDVLSRDQQRLAGTRADQVVVLDLRTMERLSLSSPEALPASALAFSRDHQFLAAGYQDGVIRIWHLRSREIRHRLKQSSLTFAFSLDGRTGAAAGATRGRVNLWNLRSDKLLYTLQTPMDIVFTVRFSTDGTELYVNGPTETQGAYNQFIRVPSWQEIEGRSSVRLE